MRNLLMLMLLITTPLDAAWAQSWGWGDTGPRFRRYYEDRYSNPWQNDEPRRMRRGGWWNSPWDDPYERGWQESPEVVDGGARPNIASMAPELVPFASQYAPGSIVIETHGKQLFFVKSSTEAYRYPISVGRDGFTWNGTEKISRIAEWPDWHPPAEMRERDPSLPVKMTGGLKNPLGAKAIYLGNTLYRIHGTNDAKTIGQAASSGCFRMLNGHVIDLSERVQVGGSVTVIERLPVEIARALPPLPRMGTSREQARARRQ